MIPSDVYQIISKYMTFRNKLKICALNKITNSNIYIYDVGNIRTVPSDALLQRKYKNLKKLRFATDKPKDIISRLHNLTELAIDFNEKISFNDLLHLTKLRGLTIFSEMSDIYKLNDLTNLEFLHLCTKNQINNDDISKLKNLKKIRIEGVSNITSLNSLPQLEKIVCFHNSKLTTASISALTNLTHLHTVCDHALFDINCLTNLKKLNCYKSNITDNGIKELKNLESLDMSECKFIKDINSLTKLKTLRCSRSELTNDGIKNLRNIETLDISSTNITEFSHLTKIKELVVTNVPNNDLGMFQDLEDITIARELNKIIINLPINTRVLRIHGNPKKLKSNLKVVYKRYNGHKRTSLYFKRNKK